MGFGARRMDNLIDRVFGRLVVIDIAGISTNGNYLWSCVCECGTGTTVSGSDLKSGHTKSCGCLRSERISALAKSRARTLRIGERFGLLIVLAAADCEDGTNRPMARVRCDCGTTVVVRIANLFSGNTRSCGCRKRSGRRINRPLPTHPWNQRA